jgi:hypothetical protein
MCRHLLHLLMILLLAVALQHNPLLRCMLLQPCCAGCNDPQRGQRRITWQQSRKRRAVAEGWLDYPFTASRKVPAQWP